MPHFVSVFVDPDAFKANLEAYDENLDWLVPNDMAVTDKTNKMEIGRQIREIYTGGEPLADHLGDGIRVSIKFI